mgnify:CR=1 FL=1
MNFLKKINCKNRKFSVFHFLTGRFWTVFWTNAIFWALLSAFLQFFLKIRVILIQFSCALPRTAGLAARMLACFACCGFCLRKTRLFFVCASAHDRACSPDWNPGVAGRQWAPSEGWKAGFDSYSFF